jgi:hypothetical protein
VQHGATEEAPGADRVRMSFGVKRCASWRRTRTGSPKSRELDVHPGDDVDFTTLVNPASIRVMSNAKVEPSVLGDAADARYQFERTGYFVKDVGDWSDERPVFNRTVTLRDSWAKVKGT